MANEDKGDRLELRIAVPGELTVGTYSNLLGVWHTENEFTLDFAVVGQPDSAEDGQPSGTITAPVVARIKVPTNVIFKIAKAIADNVSKYEDNYGPIVEVQDPNPLYPPKDDPT